MAGIAGEFSVLPSPQKTKHEMSFKKGGLWSKLRCGIRAESSKHSGRFCSANFSEQKNPRQSSRSCVLNNTEVYVSTKERGDEWGPVPPHAHKLSQHERRAKCNNEDAKPVCLIL